MGCDPPASDGKPEEEIPVEIPFLEKFILLDGNQSMKMETPIINNNKLIVMMEDYDTDEGWIHCYDKNSLEILWTWREALDELGVPAKGFGVESYLKDDILCIKQLNISYGIDPDTGMTIWKNRESSGQGSLKASDTEYITGLDFDGMFDERYVAEAAHISNGQWKHYFTFDKEDSFRVSGGAPHPFRWNGKDYMTFITAKWNTGPHITQHWLNLYSLTDEELVWTSDTIPKKYNLSGTPGVQPEFHDGQILLANESIYSYNVEDGSLEWWENDHSNSFVLSSQLVTGDGLVYANNSDNYFIGLDVHTGEEKFRTISGGSASFITYQDGKCYMSEVTRGGRSHLMIIDGENGEVLRDVIAPEIEGYDEPFERSIAVDPETGYVYTANRRYLLVYDFEL